VSDLTSWRNLQTKHHFAWLQVERVQNPSLYQQYMIKKKDVEQHFTSPQPVERELFHGTSEEDAKKICAHGFDRGFAGKNGKFNIIVICLT